MTSPIAARGYLEASTLLAGSFGGLLACFLYLLMNVPDHKGFRVTS